MPNRPDRGRHRFPRVVPAAIALACLVCAALSGTALAQNARWAIFVMKPDGSQVRMLAQVEGCTKHGTPRWSHDGQRVAFDANPGSSRSGAVYVVKADGSGLRKLGEHARPDWSPDDKQIAFESYSGGAAPQINVQNVDGEGRTQVAAGSYPRWSPDGSRLAVSDRNNVRVIDLVSGEELALFGTPVDQVYGLAWLRDGKRLAIVARPEPRKHRQLLIVSADGDTKGVHQRLENEMGGFASSSPDGKKLVIDNHYQMHIVDLDGNSKPVLVPGQKGGNIDPDWSPDGEWIVFASSRDP